MLLFSSDVLKWFLIIMSVFGYFLYMLIRRYSHWERRNVPQVSFPQDLLLFTETNFSIALKIVYDQLTPHPIGGAYVGTAPVILVRDPAIIKSILIKDFYSFINRAAVIDENLDPLSVNLLNLRDERWRKIRNKLTPTFSSGKIRAMFGLMDECTEELLESLNRTVKTCEEVDVRQLTAKYSADVIGRCAFGLDCQAVKNEGSEFRRIITFIITQFKYQTFFRTLLYNIHPKLTGWFRVKRFGAEVEQFFFSLTRETIKNRVENELKRNDFLQLMINAQHEDKKQRLSQNDKSEPLLPDHIMAANVFLFFFAGFDTTSISLSCALYELAFHPDIVDRLYKEIKLVEKAHGEKLDYESLQGMPYMECVVSEVLRKHPAAGFLERSCNNTYPVPNSTVVIEKGTRVIIPIYALHCDPLYYPDPEKFDPERFNEENKSKIVPGSYIPFGDGPRNCIGMRFALLEIKAALAKIIGNYTIHPSKKTTIPIAMIPDSLNLAPRDIYLKFQKR